MNRYRLEYHLEPPDPAPPERRPGASGRAPVGETPPRRGRESLHPEGAGDVYNVRRELNLDGREPWLEVLDRAARAFGTHPNLPVGANWGNIERITVLGVNQATWNTWRGREIEMVPGEPSFITDALPYLRRVIRRVFPGTPGRWSPLYEIEPDPIRDPEERRRFGMIDAMDREHPRPKLWKMNKRLEEAGLTPLIEREDSLIIIGKSKANAAYMQHNDNYKRFIAELLPADLSLDVVDHRAAAAQV
jgi:hypothetical protein